MFQKILLSAAAILLPTVSFAGSFVSSSKGTKLYLSELNSGSEGHYVTSVNGSEVRGTFSIEMSAPNNDYGAVRYVGSFHERGTTCSGRITLDVDGTRFTNFSIPRAAKATWEVLTGMGCTDLDKTFVVNMNEALPQPEGNQWTALSVETWFEPYNISSVWPAWQVVAHVTDCLERPSRYGELLPTVREFFRSDRIELAVSREGNAYQSVVDGRTWLLTQNHCWILADTETIHPVPTLQ